MASSIDCKAPCHPPHICFTEAYRGIPKFLTNLILSLPLLYHPRPPSPVIWVISIISDFKMARLPVIKIAFAVLAVVLALSTGDRSRNSAMAEVNDGNGHISVYLRRIHIYIYVLG